MEIEDDMVHLWGEKTVKNIYWYLLFDDGLLSRYQIDWIGKLWNLNHVFFGCVCMYNNSVYWIYNISMLVSTWHNVFEVELGWVISRCRFLRLRKYKEFYTFLLKIPSLLNYTFQKLKIMPTVQK